MVESATSEQTVSHSFDDSVWEKSELNLCHTFLVQKKLGNWPRLSTFSSEKMLLAPPVTIVYLRRKFENVSIKLLELTCFNFSCKRIRAECSRGHVSFNHVTLCLLGKHFVCSA